MGTPLAREISRHQDSPCGSCNSPVSFRFVIATNKAIRPRRCMACSTPSKPQPRHQPPDQHGLVQHVVAQAPPPQHGQRREQPHHRPLHPMQVPGQHPLPASQAPPHYAQPREHWHVVLGEWLATDQTQPVQKSSVQPGRPRLPAVTQRIRSQRGQTQGNPTSQPQPRSPSSRQAGHDQHHSHPMQHTKVNEARWKHDV